MTRTNYAPDTLHPTKQWQKHAACRADDVDPDTFYPDNNAAGIEAARAICKTCPVLRACLADCLRQEGGRRSGSRFGVFAGLTPRQRERAYRRLQVSGRWPW